MKRRTVLLLALAFGIGLDPARAEPSPPAWMTAGPHLQQSSAAFELPVEVFATKLYVAVELGGHTRRFVFDTGSPSMIDQALVEELGLKAIDSNRGIDAHGAVVETAIVPVDLALGDVHIRNLPMMAAPFSASVPTRAFVGDGVLGSDLLPLGAWQIDLDRSVLRFNTDVNALPHIKQARTLKLHQFGYPHMPILDVRFARKAQSKALFDTGSPTIFAISPPDLGGARKASGVGASVAGFGSAGGSLGGQAPDSELLQATLKNLAIGKLKLGPVIAVRRDLSPSLIGARILERYVVTLDSRSETAYFHEYSREPLVTSSFGFSLAFDGHIAVGAVWDQSPAKAAGLQPGLVLTSINGKPIEFSEGGLRRALAAMGGETIDVGWEGGAARLSRKVVLPEG